MTDPLNDDEDLEGADVTPEDEPQPGEVAADDLEAAEDDEEDEPETDDGLTVKTGIIPDDAI